MKQNSHRQCHLHFSSQSLKKAALDQWSITYCFIDCHYLHCYFSQLNIWLQWVSLYVFWSISWAFDHVVLKYRAENSKLLSSLYIQTFSYVACVARPPISDVTSGTVHQMQGAKHILWHHWLRSVHSPFDLLLLEVQPSQEHLIWQCPHQGVQDPSFHVSNMPLFTRITPLRSPTKVNSAQPPWTKRIPS